MYSFKANNKKLFRSTATGIFFILLMALLLSACAKEPAPSPSPEGSGTSATEATAPQTSADTAAESEDLIIPLADITQDASFFPVVVDGTKMEVIAVKAPDGTIRTAFNTCQICYDSGRGYYKQEGDMLVCQNCGNRFPMSNVEVEAGGCNPWPIFAENKTVTDESITISFDFLKASIEIFANWK